MTTTQRAHLIIGGFPPGSVAGHDMDYARRQLLQTLSAPDNLAVTVANDFQDIERWLPGTDLLITYVAGPFPDESGNDALQKWLENGGRWFALHGTSGGKAVKGEHDGHPVKRMVKGEHHQTLGCFFLNHPPICEFDVAVAGDHRVTQGLPATFTVQDELYLIELMDPDASRILLTTELASDPSPLGFGFHFDEDTALQPDGKTRVLGYARDVGRGEVVYIGLGHCHVGRDGSPSIVDTSIHPDGTMPPEFRAVWETDAFARLLQNGIAWGLGNR
jgi:hypothetical protein